MRWAVRFALVFCFLMTASLADAASCSFLGAPGNLNFGPYDPLLPAPTDTTGSMKIKCTGTPFATVTVSIDAGANSGGSFNPRKMLSGGVNYLDYNVYTDGAFVSIWGDGSPGTSTVILTQTKNSEIFSLTLQGRIPPGQNLPIGTYTDSLTVTAVW